MSSGMRRFIGDTLFSPDYGTARCDFPGGDGAVLWDSMQKILALPDATRLFLCHDYLPNGRALMTHTTVAQQRAENIHILAAADGESYAKMRAARDAGLSMPVLILPSVQVNVRAGQLPPAEANGVSYLKTAGQSLVRFSWFRTGHRRVSVLSVGTNQETFHA